MTVSAKDLKPESSSLVSFMPSIPVGGRVKLLGRRIGPEPSRRTTACRSSGRSPPPARGSRRARAPPGRPRPARGVSTEAGSPAALSLCRELARPRLGSASCSPGGTPVGGRPGVGRGGRRPSPRFEGELGLLRRVPGEREPEVRRSACDAPQLGEPGGARDPGRPDRLPGGPAGCAAALPPGGRRSSVPHGADVLPVPTSITQTESPCSGRTRSQLP